ncbi:NAD(P)/FAD-dependent oxidoreductase [Acidianus brierleyi]|uniref:NAD(P)/FAD-dependent oxidoreductase n=1 Tax=Acidianus brierleyi TaxID=41673 RepID=UPI001442FA57|nr:NAD(P)/FAD-dependent oxidoreductase [Acidianus brierleyi]
MAGLLAGYKFRDYNPLIFDRRRTPGKKCTGIISYSTFLNLGVSKEFVDRYFKDIEIIINNKYHVYIKTNVLRLNREKLEIWLSNELTVKRPVNASINGNIVYYNNEKFTGDIIDASGWKGKAKWIRAIEYELSPINEEKITVYIDNNNPGGFSWIVPLPEKTLVGSISYSDPLRYIPKVNSKVLGIHGGAIPRVKPKFSKNAIGDSTGLIKTFTGGGIFGISEILQVLLTDKYDEKFKKLSKEVSKQYHLTSLLEKSWRISLNMGLFYNEKTIYADKEFDFHSLLFRFSN